MGKMREEFESWAMSDMGYMCGRVGGGYKDDYMDTAWLAWKASRAALCVELPPQWFSRSVDKEVMSAIGVIDALNCSGVRYE